MVLVALMAQLAEIRLELLRLHLHTFWDETSTFLTLIMLLILLPKKSKWKSNETARHLSASSFSCVNSGFWVL